MSEHRAKINSWLHEAMFGEEGESTECSMHTVYMESHMIRVTVCAEGDAFISISDKDDTDDDASVWNTSYIGGGRELLQGLESLAKFMRACGDYFEDGEKI